MKKREHISVLIFALCIFLLAYKRKKLNRVFFILFDFKSENDVIKASSIHVRVS